jgi:hypothetical protein
LEQFHSLTSEFVAAHCARDKNVERTTTQLGDAAGEVRRSAAKPWAVGKDVPEDFTEADDDRTGRHEYASRVGLAVGCWVLDVRCWMLDTAITSVIESPSPDPKRSY